MTMLFIDGFDTKDFVSKWTISAFGGGSPSFTSSTRFGTGFAVQPPDAASGGNYRAIRPFAASSQIFAGAAVKANIKSSLSYSSAILAMYGDSAATPHVYLAVTNVGAVQVWRGDPLGYSTSAPGGTMLAASAAGLVDAGWHYIEFGVTISDSVGTAVVKVDGTQVINFTGDTKNGGTNATVDAVSFANITVGSANWQSPIIDDLYVCNSGGSVNNTFVGDSRVQTSSPTGAGTVTGLTPTGSGTNYLNVNEVPDNTATFNGSSVATTRDTYALADLAGSTSSVYALQQVTSMFKSDAGAASMKPAQLSGATVSYGATHSLATGATVYTDMFETNPATSLAWTVAGVNTLEVGAEVA